ncbi:MAG: SGNH/GDSL hydrolase family protein [Brumimicrobium sp.]
MMKSITTTSFLIFIYVISGYSQCIENDKEKVLLVGDSWAFFMGVDGTINNVFDNWGHSDIEFYTNVILSENGAETNDFLEQGKQDEIANQLNNNPDIEVVHLSLGGNDVLGSWKVSFSQAQTDSLKSEVKDSLIAVIDFIKSVKPDIKILWSGYVYPNFEEVISGFWSPSDHPFYGTWEGMEFPDNEMLNVLLNDFSSDIENYYATDTLVDFVNITGLMQYTFGQDDALEVAPFGTYPAFTAPLPIGFEDYPSPQNAMRNYGITKDCFHLSVKGYEDMISYHTQKYYHKLFMEDKYFIANNDNKSGSVSSAGNISQDLILGEQNGESFSTILNFETLLNLDYEVEEASIFLRRKNQIGNNPVNDSMLLEIKSGAFGASEDIEAVDLNDSSDKEGVPCIFGNNNDEHWVRLDLPQAMMEYISVNNVTQIKLSAPENSAALIEFFGTDDPDFAPVLDIVYGENPVTSTDDNKLINTEVNVFPNPTEDKLYIETNNAIFEEVSVYNLLGKEVLFSKSREIELTRLNPGSYIVSVKTTEGATTHKIIKK